MKIAVVAANGKAGRLIVREAVSRGHEVWAVVRGENHTEAPHALVKDLFDLSAADLADFDVVVDAFGAWAPEVLPQHTTSLMHLADALSDTQTRLLVVGGAGSLYVDEAHSTQLAETPDFPADWRPLATAMADALAKLRERNDVRWTYVSPAADFVADGARSGAYLLGGEELFTNAAGQSTISYTDYAVAMLDEAERTTDAHVQQRISVVQK